jgi:hypothetical protein
VYGIVALTHGAPRDDLHHAGDRAACPAPRGRGASRGEVLDQKSGVTGTARGLMVALHGTPKSFLSPGAGWRASPKSFPRDRAVAVRTVPAVRGRLCLSVTRAARQCPQILDSRKERNVHPHASRRLPGRIVFTIGVAFDTLCLAAAIIFFLR